MVSLYTSRDLLSEGGEVEERWKKRRNVALVIDDRPAHPHIENLIAIKLFFLPPNTTYITQPMDQGVIRPLKAKYRADVVRKIIRSLELNSLLHGMQMLVSAWNELTTDTIVNCFRKAEISAVNQDAAIAGLTGWNWCSTNCSTGSYSRGYQRSFVSWCRRRFRMFSWGEQKTTNFS